MLQGVTNLSVQSSVSLQHLPYDANAEAGNLAPLLLGRLSFAKQKLAEVVRAAHAADEGGSLTKPGADLAKPGAPHAPEPAAATCLLWSLCRFLGPTACVSDIHV